ncbi:MAG TPA: iron ABC transporter permease [Acidimicrobiales bacterium]|nr:iron ABC transporter permease [Acidimicrobiales bacterium]
MADTKPLATELAVDEGAIAPLTTASSEGLEVRPARWTARVRRTSLASVALLAVAFAAGVGIGPASVPAGRVVLEVVDRLPVVSLDSGLDARQAAILWELRLPRVVLGLLVGATLSLAGGAYQGVFRNPLADPYLLGAAAGGGFGATLVLTLGAQHGWGPFDLLPTAAFVGALLAVGLTYTVGRAAGRGIEGTTGALILAGVAMASLFTALQTYLQQRTDDTLREVYTWILGGLSTSGWAEVRLILPWTAVAAAGVLLHRRPLDVLAVGDEEATTLGLPVDRTRLTVVVVASLGTAAAVAVSGLIGFVGIIVPHTVRLLVGTHSYRVILPLTLVVGGAFLVLADLVARTALSPAEVPIGVITALVGAPFFLALLGRRRP